VNSGNPFISGQKVKGESHENTAGVGHCTLVSAGFFLALAASLVAASESKEPASLLLFFLAILCSTDAAFTRIHELLHAKMT